MIPDSFLQGELKIYTATVCRLRWLKHSRSLFFPWCSYLLLLLQDKYFMKLKRIKIKSYRSDWSERGRRTNKCISLKIFLLPLIQGMALMSMANEGHGKNERA